MTASPSATDRALVARSVAKTFGSVRALDDVDFVVRPGTVHALVGENGAGKSTLAKILAGIETSDAGRMTQDGSLYAPRDRADGKARGVNMVPQQLSLVGELTLVENLLLVGSGRIARRRAARALLADTLIRAGVDVDLDVPTALLSQAHRQLGEIVVALAEGATTLILDEPTASLGPVEVGGLFAHLRALCDLGTAVVLITHRLEEVRAVADDVTVLSHGRLVHHGHARGLSAVEVARLMVGDLPEPAPRAPRTPGDAVLSAHGVSATSETDAAIVDLSLTVRSGEIVGVAGVAGSGQNTLMDVLAGLRAPASGTVEFDGRTDPDAVDLLRGGVAWIPEQRADAIVPTVPLGATLSLYDSARGERRRRAPAREAAARHLADFDVRPASPELAAGTLSGGNQQKLLVARELGRAWRGRPDGTPRAVLAYGPTQGLDLRAAQAIRGRLIAAAEAGAAVLVASHDLDEIRGLADRIVVLFSGRIVADLPAAEATTARVGAAMAGLDGTTPDTSPTDPAHRGAAAAHADPQDAS
ncbi:ATP-binding cassette domain-containing protein [Microbacterium sp. cx-59]|uniref:ATP-binding cassette domain-containing protein n=1 Tax=Microbacterium sp. cx-59 TaxID=2891207 RepID=UPI001E331125|nr:ATP-binding cassette domain-containing protein [Microbacterium sp. cx-59]MCC4908413.1 ATP-binding cassette domain-containing protein [Microbacterium sp. cx-59]